MGPKHKTVGDLLKPSFVFVSFSEENANFQLPLCKFPHDADSTTFVKKRRRSFILESTFLKQRGRIVHGTTRTLSLLPSAKAVPCILSKRDVPLMPAARNAKLPTRGVLTNQSQVAECREPLEVTAEHYADENTAQQTHDEPRKNRKQRHPTHTHKPTTEN